MWEQAAGDPEKTGAPNSSKCPDRFSSALGPGYGLFALLVPNFKNEWQRKKELDKHQLRVKKGNYATFLPHVDEPAWSVLVDNSCLFGER